MAECRAFANGRPTTNVGSTDGRCLTFRRARRTGLTVSRTTTERAESISSADAGAPR
jgi:hypothetical protein